MGWRQHKYAGEKILTNLPLSILRYLQGRIDINKSTSGNLPWWADNDESTPSRLYQWIYIFESILTNLEQWVNMEESTLMSQYWWICPVESISMNLSWWVDMKKIYTNDSILTNQQQRVNISKSIPQVNIDKSTWQSQYWWMYPKCLILMKLLLLIDTGNSLSDESILTVQYQ